MWKLCYFLIIMRMLLNKGVFDSLICETFTVFSFTEFLWLHGRLYFYGVDLCDVITNENDCGLMNGTVCFMKWFFHLNEEINSLQKPKQNGSYDVGPCSQVKLTGSERDMLAAITTRDRKWLKLKPWCHFYFRVKTRRAQFLCCSLFMFENWPHLKKKNLLNINC